MSFQLHQALAKQHAAAEVALIWHIRAVAVAHSMSESSGITMPLQSGWTVSSYSGQCKAVGHKADLEQIWSPQWHSKAILVTAMAGILAMPD